MIPVGAVQKIEIFLIQCMKLLVRMIYGVLKILPVQKNKILFLSRQQNQPNLDFRLLKDALLKERPELKTVMITRRLERTPGSVLAFCGCSLASLYHLATSSVCVLDAYWPMVSIVEHKKTLTVIQMWHAMGKIKQSGYQTLDRQYGRDGKLAELMCMHKGYDIVVAGGEALNPFYCASFGVREEQLLNIGLPRVDYLLANEEQNRSRLLERYPQFRGRKVILYAPTFRKHTVVDFNRVVAAFSSERYALIVKPHPNQRVRDEEKLAPYRCDDFSTMEVLDACDILITDYSAIAMEAAALRKKTYYYVFDYDEYKKRNGLNIDLMREMPGCVFKNIKMLVRAIDSGSYNMEALQAYCDRYLPKTLGQSASCLARLIIRCIEDGKHEGIRQGLIREAPAAANLDYQNPAG